MVTPGMRTSVLDHPIEGKGKSASAPGRAAVRPGLVVVGASTGGPQALIPLIAKLGPALPFVPLCVTLHMPRDLMPIVAAHIERRCAVRTQVVLDRTLLQYGMVYFAPGDRHLTFERTADGVEMLLLAAPSRTSCKPAIDTMFRAAARVFGPRALGIVLSGMGEDGLAGGRAIAAAGGTLMVQDKATSAVWGMPGAIVKAGLAAATLSPDAIGDEVLMRLRARGGTR